RKGIHPQTHLKDYSGILQADAFAGYNAVYDTGRVMEAGCWAHARRYFYDIHEKRPSAITTHALETIGALYGIEAEIRGKPPDERRAVRQARSAPIVTALHAWLKEQLATVSKKSVIADAIGYALNQWQALTRFLDDGRIEVGRVEMWRGGWNWHSVGPYRKIRRASNRLGTPFPHPAHRTGRADFPHPALFRVNKPSHSRGRCAFVNGSVPTCRIGTGRSIG